MVEVRKCRECGQPLKKYRYESRAKYKKKQFCCLEHAHTFFKKHKTGWFSDKTRDYGLSWEDKEVLKALAEFGYTGDENIDMTEYLQIKKELTTHNMKGKL